MNHVGTWPHNIVGVYSQLRETPYIDCIIEIHHMVSIRKEADWIKFIEEQTREWSIT
jgi:hypothetical protein